MTTESPVKKSFLSRLKDALEHGKAASLFIGLVASMVMGVYHFFAPELEARQAYATLKPVVEDSANEIRDLKTSLVEIEGLKARLDSYERMLVLVNPCSKSSDAGPRASARKSFEDSEEKSVDVISEMLISAPPEPVQRVQLPDAPWSSK